MEKTSDHVFELRCVSCDMCIRRISGVELRSLHGGALRALFDELLELHRRACVIKAKNQAEADARNRRGR